jgi:predicted MFS family arabinose efflux permease
VVDPAKFPRPPAPTLLGLLKLLRYPPIVIVSLNGAILFAAYYALNVSYPTFLEETYGFSTTEVGIAYLAPGQASFLCSPPQFHSFNPEQASALSPAP